VSPAIALSLLLVALPVLARGPALPEIVDPTENDTPAKPAELNWRATQVNRCANAKGGVALQDTPCAPVAADAASAAPEVAELTSLPPRDLARATHAVAPEAETRSWIRGALNGAWKLGLLVLAGYALFRSARALRERLEYRRAFARDTRTRRTR
jgi:hypothetical protein